MRYQQYIDGKLSSRIPVGIQADLSGYDLNPHQKALAEWALRRGKAAIFADIGAELKESYFNQAVQNLANASKQGDLFVA